MILVLCYDVVSNSRRNKLHRRLKAFLRPVQKSVFEGWLHPGRYGELLAVVHEIINHDVDTVRIYHLCRGCAALTDLIGTAAPTDDPRADTIVSAPPILRGSPHETIRSLTGELR